jgi:allophanate hydrolase
VGSHPLRVRGLRAEYGAGRLRPRQVVEEVLRRIEARGDDSVWISRFDAATLLRRAAELEARYGAGPLPPL